MYTLRRISKNGLETNQYLGESYTVIDRDLDDEFKRSYQAVFNRPVPDDTDVYAFVGNENGDVIFPLYENQRNYIVSPNGATFSNLTYN